MKVIFRQSGGLAGLLRGCRLDSMLLPPEEAAELVKLVAESGLLDSAGGSPKSSGRGRDLMQYEIRIEPGIAVTFDDSTLPEAARPLVQFLKRHAKPVPPD